MNRTFLKQSVMKNCLGQDNLCTTSSGVYITDLSIWDKALTSTEMITWTTCRFCKGTVIADS